MVDCIIKTGEVARYAVTKASAQLCWVGWSKTKPRRSCVSVVAHQRMRARTDNPNIYYNGSASSPDKILQGGQSMSSPSYVTLGHEMAHKFDQNLGIRNAFWFGAGDDKRGVDEYNAMYYENVLRQANGLPLRTAYQETNGVTQGVILNATGNLQPMPAGLSSQGVSLPAFHALQLFLRIF